MTSPSLCSSTTHAAVRTSSDVQNGKSTKINSKFEVRSVSSGEDAQGEAVVTCEYNNRSYRGTSVTTDIVESGVRAFIEVINAIESSRRRGADQNDTPPAAAGMPARSAR